jgi:Flp pilus assembly protein TadG
MSSQKRPRKHGRNGGQAIVEFALVIPVFLMILFGILDFGFALYSRITLINATREGAHAAVTQVDNAPGIPVMVEAAIRANSNTLVWSDVTVTTTCVRPSGACNFSGVAGTLAPGDSIRVATSYVYHSFFARFLGATVPMGTNVSMVVE